MPAGFQPFVVAQLGADAPVGRALSLAGAWIDAAAIEQNAILVHKDPELGALKLEQEMLPFKN